MSFVSHNLYFIHLFCFINTTTTNNLYKNIKKLKIAK